MHLIALIQFMLMVADIITDPLQLYSIWLLAEKAEKKRSSFFNLPEADFFMQAFSSLVGIIGFSGLLQAFFSLRALTSCKQVWQKGTSWQIVVIVICCLQGDVCLC